MMMVIEHDFQYDPRDGRVQCTRCGACTDPECCPGEVGAPCGEPTPTLPKVGDRIVLEFTSDPATKLVPGDAGTVALIDALNTIHVNWDSGSTLGLVPDEDRWRGES